MNTTIMIIYGIGTIIFIVNLLLSVLTMKFEKQSKKLWLLAVIAFVIDLIGITTYDLGKVDNNVVTHNNGLYYFLRTINLIIQLFVFIMTILNIIKNKKKQKQKRKNRPNIN